MEPESSLPQSQETATHPYPEPHQSSPCPLFHFLKTHFNIILPSTRGSSNWSFSSTVLIFQIEWCFAVHSAPLSVTRIIKISNYWTTATSVLERIRKEVFVASSKVLNITWFTYEAWLHLPG